MNKKLLFILIISQIYSQLWTPFHPHEKANHNQHIISYELTDSIAKNKQIHSKRFQLTHEVVGYLPYWEYHEYPELDYSLISQINYFSAELNQFGDIINSNNWENLYFVDYAQSQGVKVKLCATLFDSGSLSTLLSSYFYRQNAINNLLNLILQVEADGIDIDFENLPVSQKENLVLFMEELSTTFHSFIEDPIITMAVPAIDWSNSWDIEQLVNIVDGLFIMGYNYFYSGSQQAGPVSPLGGYFYDLNYTVNDYTNKAGNQTNKLILGLPYYGYDWPVVNSIINSNTLNLGSAKTFADYKISYSEYESYWDNSSSTAWISYTNSNTNSWNQYWFDNTESLARKYEFAKSENLSGVGIWAFGYDDDYPDLWDILYNSFVNELQGDVNNDFSINIQDILLVVDVIINDVLIDNTTDFNSDNLTDVLDILYLINIILNQ